MSMCIVFSLLIGKGCLLWPGFSLKKTPLAFPLLHFVLQGQTCLSFRVFLDFLLLHSNPLWWKGHFFFFFNGSSRRCCRYSQNLSASAPSASVVGYRLGLLCCWMIYLENELRSFCYFWGCTRVLHFELCSWPQRSNCQHPLDHGKSKRVPEKTYISALLTMPKPLTVWITINCGKFWKR